MNRHIRLVFLLLIFMAGCETTSPLARKTPQRIVRIAILKNADYVTVEMRGQYKIVDPLTNQTLEEGRRLRSTKITAYSRGVKFGEKRYSHEGIRLVPGKDVRISAGRRRKHYRGSIDIIPKEDQGLLVINRLGIEDYVKGILYHEASARWPMETLKAQAVAARTYALYHIAENVDQEYDVTSDIYSQVYGGRTAERYRTNLAVERTDSEVMKFQGNILPAYYHATCGGVTEDVRQIWDHENLSPLQGVRCGFCLRSPHYRWKRNFRSQDIQEALNAKGHPLGLIKDIRAVGYNESGRIKNLKITARDNKSIIVAGKDFRGIIGPNKIKSNKYRIVMKGYYFDLVGEGWGHGVGMCQWGARRMAQKRHAYDAILQHYYPGVEIINLSRNRKP